MTDNPYRPPSSHEATQGSPATILWKSIFVAVAITLGISFALGALWGLAGLAGYLVFGSQADIFYEHPIASVVGWCIGLVPFVMGLLYLRRAIDRSRMLHCLLFAALNIVASIPFIYFDAGPVSWTTVAFLLLQVAIALVAGMVWRSPPSIQD